MLTGKQKRFLRAKGSTLEAIVYIGKLGMEAEIIASLEVALIARELVKVRVLPNSPIEPEAALGFLATESGAELVQVIGRNGLLYRQNPERARIELP